MLIFFRSNIKLINLLGSFSRPEIRGMHRYQCEKRKNSRINCRTRDLYIQASQTLNESAAKRGDDKRRLARGRIFAGLKGKIESFTTCILISPFSLFKGARDRIAEIKGRYTYSRAHRKNMLRQFAMIVFLFVATDCATFLKRKKNHSCSVTVNVFLLLINLFV